MPCIVRHDEAILAMTDDNLRHRERILPTEKAAALKQQVEAVKHQGCMAPPPCGGLPFTGDPGCAIPGGVMGAYPPELPPFP